MLVSILTHVAFGVLGGLIGSVIVLKVISCLPIGPFK